MSSLVVPSYSPRAAEFEHQEFQYSYQFLFITSAQEDEIREQISNLGELEGGWLEGTGKALDPDELAKLAERLVQHYPLSAPELRLYPKADGNVQAEWWIGNYSAVLEVFLDESGVAEWSDYNHQTSQETERSVNINNKRDWEWVVQRLQSFS